VPIRPCVYAARRFSDGAAASTACRSGRCGEPSDLLGLPIDKVRVELGDTDFPAAPGSGGSFGANSAGSAVYDACMNLGAALLQKAGLNPDMPSKPDDASRSAGSMNASTNSSDCR
jgi:CO/xanthine dehydrogenase Mo-binding subunit